MKLIPDWKRIIKKAWSFRLLAVSALLTACEVALPLFGDAIPRGLFAALSGITATGAMAARIVAQKEFEHGR